MDQSNRLMFWLTLGVFLLSAAAAILSENAIVVLPGLVALVALVLLPLTEARRDEQP